MMDISRDQIAQESKTWSTTGNLNLEEEYIRVCAILESGILEPTMEPTGLRYNLTHHLTGVMADILLTLQAILNFKTSPLILAKEFFPSTPSSIGSTVSNSSALNATQNYEISAVSEYMQRGDTDLSLGFLYYVPARLQVGNILIPLSDEIFEIYFRQPGRITSENPFDKQIAPEVATALCIIIIFSAIILSVSFVLKMHNSRHMEISPKTVNLGVLKDILSGLYDAWFWAFGTWAQQGPVLRLPAWQAKLTMYLITVLSYLIYSIYCAILIASLTRNSAPIKDLEDLTRYKYSIFAFGDVRDRLFLGGESNLLWSPPPPGKIMEEESLGEYEKMESIKRILTHRHAHVDTYDNFFPDLKSTPLYNNLCKKLSILLYKGGRVQSGIYVRKNFQYRSEFNFALIRLRECGVDKRMQERFERVHKQDSCQASNSKSYQDNLGMSQIGIMFIFLGMWYTASLILYGVETLLNKMRKSNLSKYCVT